MSLHRVFYDRETQPGTTAMTRPIFVHSVEAFKDMRLICCRDTGSVVRDSQRKLLRMRLCRNRNAWLVFVPVFQRIVEQV